MLLAREGRDCTRNEIMRVGGLWLLIRGLKTTGVCEDKGVEVLVRILGCSELSFGNLAEMA